jgi:ankyrin repeat protein
MRAVPSENNQRDAMLHYAVTRGDLPIVEFMINRCHADIEITDSNGNTALLLAANRLYQTSLNSCCKRAKRED